jgi:hypothetical protein
MDANEISFENLPKAVAHLVSELAEIKSLVEKGQTPIVLQKRIPIDIYCCPLKLFEPKN